MKKSQMREMSIEVTVGAFIFMILLALGVFTIILSQDNFFVKNYEVQVRFNEVSGLRSGDKVFLRGVDIGKISNIEIESDGVLLTATLEKDITFTEDYAIEIIPVSVLGGKRLVINPGSSAEDPLPAGTILAGTPPKDVITEATDTIAMIRKSLDDGKVLDNLSRVVADLRTVSEKISSGEGTIGKLVMDDSLYTNVNHVVSDLKNVSERLSNGEGTLGRLINDGGMYDELMSVVGDFRSASEDFGNALGGANELVDRVRAGEGTLGRLLVGETLADDLEATVANIRSFSEKLNSGEGTLGKLVADDSLYIELRGMLNKADQALDSLGDSGPITAVGALSGALF